MPFEEFWVEYISRKRRAFFGFVLQFWLNYCSVFFQ